ncbi:acyl-CoA thioesterase [Actinomadura sp. 21ATH]|uniref:acyl-CoA thioesterase n=1 Tax=Actinomadura sp. 21ATH TaxID=1735444 RepID=UPI0035C2285B
MTGAAEETLPSVLDLLALEELDRDLYRTTVAFDDPYPLYGGQVAAQALRAAGGTVPEGRLPHSLHGYYLRGGDAARPTIFRVDRDRDGRSFSARRVVALQGGEVIFNMSASFHTPEDDDDRQAHPMPAAPPPEESAGDALPRLFSLEGRVPPQPYESDWPTRMWARSTLPLPADPLVHACVLTYLSDISSGLAALHDGPGRSGSSLDHAVWFHRPVRMDDWVLMDLVPHTVAAGRGWYTGSIHAHDGTLAASLTQEALFRTPRTA